MCPGTGFSGTFYAVHVCQCHIVQDTAYQHNAANLVSVPPVLSRQHHRLCSQPIALSAIMREWRSLYLHYSVSLCHSPAQYLHYAVHVSCIVQCLFPVQSRFYPSPGSWLIDKEGDQSPVPVPTHLLPLASSATAFKPCQDYIAFCCQACLLAVNLYFFLFRPKPVSWICEFCLALWNFCLDLLPFCY